MKVRTLLDLLVGYNPDAHVVILDEQEGMLYEPASITNSDNEIYSTTDGKEAVGEVVILGGD